jgi:uncharacterized membrane protein
MLSLVWGILALLGFLFGFIPCLGWWNWLNIPFAVIGLVISIIAHSQAPPDKKNLALTGIVLCAIAAFIGFFRLKAGGGIL